MGGINTNPMAANLIGTPDLDSAANAIEELNLVSPEEPRQKKERKPRQKKATSTVQPDLNEPSLGQMMFGESMVETQALAISFLSGFVATPESAFKIYQTHLIEENKKKLQRAFAVMAKEFGFEVSGKMMALGMVATVEMAVLRECYNHLEFKQTEETES